MMLNDSIAPMDELWETSDSDTHVDALREDRLERLGSETYLFGTPVVSDGVTVRAEHLVVRLDKRQRVSTGERLRLRVHPEEELVFDADGNRVPHEI